MLSSVKIKSIKEIGFKNTYDLLISRYHNFFLSNNILTHNCSGLPGCHIAGTKVLMADGSWKKIEKLKDGELIMSPQENGKVIPSKIIGCHKWFSKDNYKIYYKNKKGKEIELYKCSFNHNVIVVGKGVLKEGYIPAYLLNLYSKEKLKTYSLNPYTNKKKFYKIYLRKIKSAMVYGFEVLPSHNFICNNYIVSKNSGKSTFAKTLGKYLDPNFDETHFAFSDEEFIHLTNTLPEHSCVVLDESFESLNARVSLSKGFLRIVNHLQLLRQRHLFLILCLPNFFDLSKGIAVFRSSHLFVTYATDYGERGRFLAFGRDAKRKLYVIGSKFMDYSAHPANFKGKFARNLHILNEKRYEKKKFQHLNDWSHQKNDYGDMTQTKINKFHEAIFRGLTSKTMSVHQASQIFSLSEDTVKEIYRKKLMEYGNVDGGVLSDFKIL